MVGGHSMGGVAKRKDGTLLMELMLALGVIAVALMPLAYSFAHEQKLCRAYYHRAVAMEIVDGEMEILAAGEWRHFKPGAQAYTVRAESAKNLPPGHFTLNVGKQRVRLDWEPDQPDQGGKIFREIRTP